MVFTFERLFLFDSLLKRVIMVTDNLALSYVLKDIKGVLLRVRQSLFDFQE